MEKEGEFDYLWNPYTVVISRQSNLGSYCCASPQDAIDHLEQQWYDEILVGGGSQTNTLFFQKKVIDEIVVDIEPHLFGSWKPLFEDCDVQATLELIDSKKLNDHTMQLHYRVMYE